MCWGTNAAGQLGNNSYTASYVPIDVPSLTSGVRQVAFGELHVCAVLETGGVKCWGFDNQCGFLGNGSTNVKRVPTDVEGLPGPVFSVVGGAQFTCALLESGAVYCWGCNNFGQLGNNTTQDSGTPQQVSGLDAGVVHLSAGYAHACAVTSDGRLLCWGYNEFWQVGDADNAQNALVPVEVQGL
ncbi:MAG: RCC1 domain-containing protein [Myxococcales bacterium]|jgi:alpha-tubulin suppressor-like RCC1 family protein